MIISQGTRISSQGEYPLSGQQKCHVAQDQWMKECWQVLSSFEHPILLCCQSNAKGHIDIKYCPTDKMIRDYMTKPLHGAKFDGFHQQIMHLPVVAQLMTAAVLN